METKAAYSQPLYLRLYPSRVFRPSLAHALRRTIPRFPIYPRYPHSRVPLKIPETVLRSLLFRDEYLGSLSISRVEEANVWTGPADRPTYRVC